MVLAHGNAPGSIGYQPIALLLSYTRKSWRRAEDLRLNRQSRSICFRNSARTSAGSLSKVAESSGPAPQASRPETASNRSPRFAVLLSEKMAEARGHAPQRRVAAQSASNGCRRLVRFRLRKVPAAGFAPASIRLEGGGLSFSATRSKWTSRRDSHPQHGVRSAA